MSRSWMSAFALGVALACGLSSVAFVHADEYGDVNGDAEAPVIRKALDCLWLTSLARDAMESVTDRAKLDEPTRESVRARAEEARTHVGLGKQLIDEASGLQPTTDAAFAHDSLSTADAALVKLLKKLEKPVKAKTARKALDATDRSLRAAKLSMQGVFVEEKERLERLTAGLPAEAYFENFDRASVRALVKLLAPSGPGAKATSRRADKKKPRRIAAAREYVVDADLAQVRAVKRKSPPGGKTPGAPTDFNLSFKAASKKQATPGAYRIGLGRAVRGPFVAGATLGLLDPKKGDDTYQAHARLEVEIEGSSPREYVAIGIRPTETGMRAFVETTGGEAQRVRDFADVASADVRMEFDGVNFRIYARPEGEGRFELVDTHFRRQDDDRWNLSFGAGGLTGKAEIGVDKVFVHAD